jgi:hypothetical protein
MVKKTQLGGSASLAEFRPKRGPCQHGFIPSRQLSVPQRLRVRRGCAGGHGLTRTRLWPKAQRLADLERDKFSKNRKRGFAPHKTMILLSALRQGVPKQSKETTSTRNSSPYYLTNASLKLLKSSGPGQLQSVPGVVLVSSPHPSFVMEPAQD